MYTSRQVTRFLGPVLKSYEKKYPLMSRFIRADSGFAVPGLYKLIEDNKSFYAIRLKAYKTLYTKASHITERMEFACKNNIHDYKVIYGEITYKASSWDKERRVVVKMKSLKVKCATTTLL